MQFLHRSRPGPREAASALSLLLPISMGVKRLEDLIAFQLARAFKREVYALVRAHPPAFDDRGYRSQLWDAASSGEQNIREGFGRFTAAEFHQFLRYSRASIDEAKGRVEDGVDRGYFPVEACQDALTLGSRAGAAAAGLQRSLRPFIEERRKERRTTRPVARRASG